MRLKTCTTNKDDFEKVAKFAKWVVDIGEGNLTTISLEEDDEPTWVEIPDEFIISQSDDNIAEIVTAIYLELDKNLMNTNVLRDRCILAPTNDCAEEIISYAISLISGSLRNYLSADSISPSSDTIDDQNIMYPA